MLVERHIIFSKIIPNRLKAAPFQNWFFIFDVPWNVFFFLLFLFWLISCWKRCDVFWSDCFIIQGMIIREKCWKIPRSRCFVIFNWWCASRLSILLLRVWKSSYLGLFTKWGLFCVEVCHHILSLDIWPLILFKVFHVIFWSWSCSLLNLESIWVIFHSIDLT